MSNSNPALFAVGDDVLHKPIEDGVVLLNLKNRRFYELDGMGARVWQLLLEHRDLQTVADCISDEYNAETSTILPDIEAITQDLCASGLLKSVG